VVDVVKNRKEIKKWDKPEHEDLDLSEYQIDELDLS